MGLNLYCMSHSEYPSPPSGSIQGEKGTKEGDICPAEAFSKVTCIKVLGKPHKSSSGGRAVECRGQDIHTGVSWCCGTLDKSLNPHTSDLLYEVGGLNEVI